MTDLLDTLAEIVGDTKGLLKTAVELQNLDFDPRCEIPAHATVKQFHSGAATHLVIAPCSSCMVCALFAEVIEMLGGVACLNCHSQHSLSDLIIRPLPGNPNA